MSLLSDVLHVPLLSYLMLPLLFLLLVLSVSHTHTYVLVPLNWSMEQTCINALTQHDNSDKTPTPLCKQLIPPPTPTYTHSANFGKLEERSFKPCSTFLSLTPLVCVFPSPHISTLLCTVKNWKLPHYKCIVRCSLHTSYVRDRFHCFCENSWPLQSQQWQV